MKSRVVRLSLSLTFLLVLILAFAKYSSLPVKREDGVFNVDPPTPYSHYLPSGAPRGRILVVHGIDANKGMMNLLSYALADAGFEVFSVDLPGHGESTIPFNALRARDAVAHVLDQLGPDTLVIGHSMGAALLLDLANDRSMKSMVLLSPAPVPLVKIHSERILLFEAQFDVPPIRPFVAGLAAEIEAAAPGTVELRDLPWTGHSGALAQPGTIEYVAGWLGGDVRQLHTLERIGLLLLMFVSAIGLGITLLGWSKETSRLMIFALPIRISILSYVAATMVAVAILGWIPLTHWLRLFGTDYLIGVLFLTGSVLCLGRARVRLEPGSILIAVAAAAYVIAIPGVLIASEFTHFTLSAGRSWRFPAIAILGLPFFLADEMLLRPIQSRWKAASMALLTRMLLAAIVVTATLLWKRENALLILIIHLLVVFWMILWLAGGLIYRRTQNPLAAALFNSLVQAWLFAALFVTT